MSSESAWPPGNAPRPSRVVVTGQPIFSAKAQTATCSVQADDPLRIWVNDKSVFDRPTASAAEATFSVSLKAGWNAVLVKVSSAGKAHRLGLRFTGTELRTAGVPEAVATGAAGGGQ